MPSGICLVVAGYHRSGTSMTMQALSRAGVSIGLNLLGPDPTNPDGHFESNEVIKIHETALDCNGIDWLSGNYPSDSFLYWNESTYSRAHEFVDRFSGESVWGFKDPRVCLFLSQWKEIIQNMIVVGVYRHYLECIQSLRNRASQLLSINPNLDSAHAKIWTDANCALIGWISYNSSLLKFVKQNPTKCILTSQNRILEGYPLVDRINKKFMLSLNAHCDIGVDLEKTSSTLSFPVGGIDSGLIARADALWDQLNTVAKQNIPAPTYCPGAGSGRFSLEFRSIRNTLYGGYGKEDTNKPVVAKIPVSSNSIKLGSSNCISLIPEFSAFTEGDVRRYRPVIRSHLVNGNNPAVEEAIKTYESGGCNSYFGELVLAERWLRLNELEKATFHLENSAVLNSSDGFIPYFKGMVQEKLGDSGDSIKLYSQAMELSPGNVFFTIACVRALMAKDCLDTALKVIKEGLSESGRNIQLELMQVKILVRLGVSQEADGVLERALLNWPKNISLWAERYSLKCLMDEKEEARRSYNIHAGLTILANPNHFEDINSIFDSIVDLNLKSEFIDVVEGNILLFTEELKELEREQRELV